jgi:hypothetical protein
MCALLAIGAWSNLSRKQSALFRGKNTIIVDECLLSNPVILHNVWLQLQSLQLVDDFCSLSVQITFQFRHYQGLISSYMV